MGEEGTWDKTPYGKMSQTQNHQSHLSDRSGDYHTDAWVTSPQKCLQTTLWKAFYRTKSAFYHNFTKAYSRGHSYSAIIQHWYRYWLGNERRQAISRTNDDQLMSLTYIFVTRGHFINLDWFLCQKGQVITYPSKPRGDFIYPLEVWERISNSITHFIMDVITYPCWDQS